MTYFNRYYLLPAAALAVYLTLFAHAVVVSSRAESAPLAAARFDGGANSAEALIDQFLAALAAKDAVALQQLRVNRDEYLDIIVPGTVEPGQPLRQVSAQPKEFFWRMLNDKNRDFGDVLLQRFGGHRFRREQVSFTQATIRYATYEALGETRVAVSEEGGKQDMISTGWIAAVGGRYKFVSYEWDD